MPLRPPAAIPIHPNPCRARRRIASIGSLCALLVLTGCADFAPFRAVRISTAATSQTLCTAAFVSKMDPERAYRDEVRPAPGMSLVAWGLRYRIDPDSQSVSTDILGRAERRSIYREGLGCVVALGEVRPERWQAPPADPATPDPFPSLASATPVQAPDPRIREAIDLAFEEPASGAPRRTQAVVVVHRGRLIGERYADDVRLDTPLQGHSISKSLTHALIGILARQ